MEDKETKTSIDVEYKKVINESFEDFIDFSKGISDKTTISQDEIMSLKYVWLAEDVFHIDTYDDNLSEKFGRAILEVLRVIKNRQNYEYIKNEDNYIKYILVCNLLDMNDLISWGTSIRGAWFEFMDYGGYDDHRRIFIEPHDNGKGYAEWSEEVINYLICQFFNEKEEANKIC